MSILKFIASRLTGGAWADTAEAVVSWRWEAARTRYICGEFPPIPLF